MAMPDPASLPEPSPMARLFDSIYWGKDPSFWRHLTRAKSKDVMLEAFARARSFKAPKPFTVASFHALPPAVATDYIRIARMAACTDDEVELAIAYLHSQNPEHPFPAALIDPRHRMERWPYAFCSPCG
jgi:hypothetical protein